MESQPEPAAERPPLGLPLGSVRALLTLLIVTVVIADVARGREVEILWKETLLIALAHYFTSRRFVRLPPAALQHLEHEGHLPRESNPLFLPSHTVRAAIVLAFIGLGVYLYREGRLFESQSLTVLGVVLAYLLGVVAGGIRKWWARNRVSRSILWWEDAKAIAVLLALLITAAVSLLNRPELLPDEWRTAALAFVLFYFGSR